MGTLMKAPTFLNRLNSSGCPVPGSVHGQVAWGFEQPGGVEAVPVHGKGLELDDL